MNIVDLFKFAIDFVLHLDHYLTQIVNAVGGWTYAVLFLVIFIETGVVVMPFLPGDSLLFAAGAIAALPGSVLNVVTMYLLLALAAVLGDTANYWIGHKIGERAFSGSIRWLKKEHLDRTQKFYEKHGGITIFLARFIPIIRTFAPFVAGVGRMRYGYFLTYNLIGGVTWTALFIFLGYFFGNLPFVRDHFSLVVIAIVVISFIPAVTEALKARAEGKKAAAEAAADAERKKAAEAESEAAAKAESKKAAVSESTAND